MQISKIKWDLMAKLYSTDFFKNIENGSVVFAKDLYQNNIEIAAVPFNYWSLYSKRYGNKEIAIVDESEERYKNFYEMKSSIELKFKEPMSIKKAFIYCYDRKLKKIVIVKTSETSERFVLMAQGNALSEVQFDGYSKEIEVNQDVEDINFL